jgi:dynein heavy chain 1
MESLVTSSGPSSPKTNGTDTFVVDPTLIVDYLASVLEITLGATRKDLEKYGSLLSPDSRPHTIQRCTRFASENQVALYVTKEIATTGAIDGVLDGPSNSSLRFAYCLILTFSSRHCNIQLQYCNRHFLFPFDDGIDRRFETALSYRSYDTHYITSTSY